MNIYIETYGCTFNQGDSQIMAGLLQEEGENIVSSPADADLIVINTCYVKHPTEQKMINRIHRMKTEFPHKNLVIAGCMVEIDPEKLEKIVPHAGWVGPRKIRAIPDAVRSVLDGNKVRLTGLGNDLKVCLPKIRFNPLVHIIQIAEGCVGECGYCCTRFARGELQSYPMKMIKQELADAVADGCRVIQVTAQDTAAYGKDRGDDLAKLLQEVTSIKGNFRIRVGMMHPQSMMDDLNHIVEAFLNEKMFKFLHIPVQSGNDQVLKDMNRRYGIKDFWDIINKFREAIPEISIATDIIVGYPTEDEDAFRDTCQLIKDVKPDFIHLSKYRHRPGAAASTMKEIDHDILKKRSKILDELKSKIIHLNNLKLVGTTQQVLITEKGRKGGYIGRTNSYKPVVVEDVLLGRFVEVEIKKARTTYLKGSVL